MLTLLKNAETYTPYYAGKKDILIAGEKIYKILPPSGIADYSLIENVTDCEGLFAFPGLVDQHVHILGGGGEQGFPSRVGELSVDEVKAAGVTTLVGLLGADGCTRSLECLYAKAKSLESEGVTTFIYSGSYALPPVTFTGNMTKDLVLIDKVIGAGEIAISDHRSSQPQLPDLLKLSSDTHLGGLLGGKAGVVHFHVGDGKGGLAPLRELAENSDLPLSMFVPTHQNRNPDLFSRSLRFCASGGNIDLTAGETAGIPVPQAVTRMLREGIDMQHVSVSSDANGSIPGGGVTKMQSLYDDLRACIVDCKIAPEKVFPLFCENPAKVLKLYPKKGCLKEGSDADILLTDKNYNIKMLFAMGKLAAKCESY